MSSSPGLSISKEREARELASPDCFVGGCSALSTVYAAEGDGCLGKGGLNKSGPGPLPNGRVSLG